ncbi:MAG: hypothetical protein KI791_15105 [Cyclobacteriaceae bacterium]|nr:hypothetical protein [Cyclobacteriaceae bacterium SS2]
MISEYSKLSPSFYGITMVPEESWKEYGYALLKIAGSDGLVSDPEMEWLTVDLAEQVGVDEEIVQAWLSFDYQKADLIKIFNSFNKKTITSFDKVLIYDAIRMSSADDEYALEERQQVAEASKLLGIRTDELVAIESLVELEKVTNKLRQNLL